MQRRLFCTKFVLPISKHCSQVDLTNDHDQSVRRISLSQEFLVPSELDGLDLEEWSQIAMNLWSRAPWFGRDAARKVELGDLYIGYDDWLPCSVPLGAFGHLRVAENLCFWGAYLYQDQAMSSVGSCQALVALALGARPSSRRLVVCQSIQALSIFSTPL